jgi:hypothetical protein
MLPESGNRVFQQNRPSADIRNVGWCRLKYCTALLGLLRRTHQVGGMPIAIRPR